MNREIREFVSQRSLWPGIVVALGGLLFASSPSVTLAQKVRAEVKTILEKLPLDKQEKLRDFASRVQDYINNYRWTEDQDAGEIRLSVQMVLEDISVSGEDRYRAELLVSLVSSPVSPKSDLQFYDRRCRFAYQKNEPLVHSEGVFAPLTGLLDYYVCLILGGEFDKYGKLLGDPYFQKARDVAEQGKFSRGQFTEGWDLRLEQAKKFLSEDFRKFREMKDYYFYGLTWVPEDENKARQYIRVAVDMLAEVLKKDPRLPQAHQFLDAHHMEIVDLFKTQSDRRIFATLLAIDPDPAHEKVYREHLPQ